MGMLSACGDGAESTGVGEDPLCLAAPSDTIVYSPLPERAPPAGVTTGSSPHRQINPLVSPSHIAELHERVFELSGLESRASLIVDDATAIWISPEINLARPGCIVAGREVAHIHLDGSVHAVLPFRRIPEAESTGWVERHPWSGRQPGFEAFVLIFTPRSSAEVRVMVDLIREGMEFVTED